jgi:hypothetical protein
MIAVDLVVNSRAWAQGEPHLLIRKELGFPLTDLSRLSDFRRRMKASHWNGRVLYSRKLAEGSTC